VSIFHRILVAFDGSQDSRAALELATELARDQDARLTLLTVVPDVPSAVTSVTVGPLDLESSYRDVQCGARDALPDDISVTTILRHGVPAERIIEAAADHDLIVMGTHGRGRFGEVLAGSVSRAVVHARRGAVLLTRAPAPTLAEAKVHSATKGEVDPSGEVDPRDDVEVLKDGGPREETPRRGVPVRDGT
jgi:nucleotide-binding universal stress UspA family protein